MLTHQRSDEQILGIRTECLEVVDEEDGVSHQWHMPTPS